MLEHHGCSENRAHGVCQILSGQRRGRTMDRLKQRHCIWMDISGSGHSQSALECGGKIRDDIAEHVVGHDHLKISRLPDHQKTKRIYIKVARLNPGVPACGLLETALPQISR